MLQKKIQSTIGLIDDVGDNRKIANENANLAKRNTSFFESLEKFTPTVLSYIIAKKQFNFKATESSANKITELISYSKTTFEKTKAINPDSFRKNVDSFIEVISQEWKKFYNDISNELISDLNIVLLIHSTPLVRNCVIALKKCEKWPLTQETVDEYMSAKRTAQDLFKEVHFSDDIKFFLKKVNMHAATLTDLTPQVLDWIQSEKISDKIALTIKSN